MAIGFVGVGTMGREMASHLLDSGVPLVVFDAHEEATATLTAAGAHKASSLADLAARSDVIFLSLPGPADVENVVTGAGGLLHAIRPGTAVFDTSTNSVAMSRKMNDALKARGAHFLDAPVSGGPSGAASRKLVVWVGGDPAAFDAHRYLLDLISDSPIYMGPSGSGAVTKLSHNLLGFTTMLALVEVLTLGAKAGLDPLDLWMALRRGSAGRGSSLDLLAKQFLPRNFDPPAFALSLAHKDLTLATALGSELGVPLRLGDLTVEDLDEAMRRGHANTDSRVFLDLQLERAGVEFNIDPERLKQAIDQIASDAT